MKRLSIALLCCLALQCPALLAQPAAPESMIPTGDAERGRRVFGACRVCHDIRPGTGHRAGPDLHGIFGRVVGTQPGFADYSELFKGAGFVWTPALMYAWLENPMGMYPESSMMSLGIPDPGARADLVAYLLAASAR